MYYLMYFHCSQTNSNMQTRDFFDDSTNDKICIKEIMTETHRARTINDVTAETQVR